MAHRVYGYYNNVDPNPHYVDLTLFFRRYLLGQVNLYWTEEYDVLVQ